MKPGLNPFETDEVLLREVLVQSSFPHEWLEVMQLLTTSQKIYFVANNKNLGNYESSVGPLPVELSEPCEGFFSPELKAIDESWYGICLHKSSDDFIKGTLYFYRPNLQAAPVKVTIQSLCKKMVQDLNDKFALRLYKDRMDQMLLYREATTLLETLTNLAPAGIFFTDSNGKKKIARRGLPSSLSVHVA